MSTLNKLEIEKRLSGDCLKHERLVITPILDKENQLEGPGVDLRLSNQFIVFKQEHVPHIDVSTLHDENIRSVQTHVVVPFHESFVLHPKNLVLASTLEYVAMPDNLAGTLEGRSSWARLGLIIATACAIDPGFKGCITLELTNLGNLPLYLYPGIRLAKLILSETSSPSPYDGKSKKYFCQVGPEFSKAYNDPDLSFFSKERKRRDASKKLTKKPHTP